MRTVIILLLSFFTVSLFAQADSTKVEWTNHENSFCKIRYPSSWKFDTSKLIGSSFFIFSPLSGPTDKFSENVNLIIQDLTGMGMDLETYKNISEEQIKTMMTGSEIYESVLAKKDTSTFYRIDYLMPQGEMKIRVTSICYIRNEKAYLLTFASRSEEFDDFKNTARKIMESFQMLL